MQQIAYPYHVEGRGRTATTDPDSHIRDMIEQVLFTTPGERVNRPTFGSGLLQLLFGAQQRRGGGRDAIPGAGRAPAVAR